MRVLSDEEDEKFRQRVRKEVGFHHEPEEGWEPLDMEDGFVVNYKEGDYEEEFENKMDEVEARSQNYRENFQKALDLIQGREDSVYILAFENGQYVSKARRKLKEEMDGNVVKVSLDEVYEMTKDLIIVYILPEDLSWIILLDHDGNIQFSGDIKKKARKAFDTD